MQRLTRSSLISALAVIFWLTFFFPISSNAGVDNSIYASLLKRFVQNGSVNYKGFKSEEKQLDVYLEVLENIDPASLPREDQFAFYINVYNAWTIKLILGAYPGVKSIKDLGSLFKSPWKKKIVRLNDGLYTLDNIEHDILRPRFKDPRVHFAINCASLSCPVLRSEPYSAKTLNAQLDNATRNFINNPKRNFMENNTLYVSKIFKWFPQDFNDAVTDFIEQYAAPSLKQNIVSRGDDIRIRYLNYDWSLNGK